MNVRPATPDDLLALTRLRWEFAAEGHWGDSNADYRAFEARFAVFLADALGSGRWVIWVAEQADQIVANIYVQLIEQVPRPGKPDRSVGWLSNVYTLPDYRNQGIGSALMRHVIDWAKSERLESLNLWYSERSVPYYERLGFTRTPDEFMLMLDDR